MQIRNQVMKKTKEIATVEILSGLSREIDVLLSIRMRNEKNSIYLDIIRKARMALRETIEY